MEQAASGPKPIARLLERGEPVAVTVRMTTGFFIVTDRRVIVASDGQRPWAGRFAELRRIELDVERDRSATLVSVPENPANPPQLLAIPESEFDAAAQTLDIIGRRLSA